MKPADFFVVGGTLSRTAPSYITRPADEELFQLIQKGEYCNVLAARQMGKSSLMVRTAERLKEKGFRTVIIDLTAIGSNVTREEWYFGVIDELNRQLGLDGDIDDWWLGNEGRGPVQRFGSFLREFVLHQVRDPVVVFVDEIDSTLHLDFTDDFFAAIRAVYNRRAEDELFKRLTFVLLGVARPAELIKDRTRTPYNIGTNIDLTDFRVEELDVFYTALETSNPGGGRKILGCVLDWTNGQPYLTQKLCSKAVAQSNGVIGFKEIEALVSDLFLGEEARKESNLRAIRDRVRSSPNAAGILRIYRQVLRGKPVKDEERSIEKNELKLTGLVRASSQGNLRVRNRIYEKVFDDAWVKENTPPSRSRRFAVIASIIAVLALAFAGYIYYNQQNLSADQSADLFRENFASSSPDLRLNGLAGLFDLGGEFAAEARDLFFNLTNEDQIAFFEDLPAPENVHTDLVIVVSGLYSDQRITNHLDNELLAVMARVLGEGGAIELRTEIEDWIDGRELAGEGQFDAAIRLYDRANESSESSDQPNPGVLFDRGGANAALGKYDDALRDYETALELDATRQEAVITRIINIPELAARWAENASQFPNLSAILPTPTGIPTVLNVENDGEILESTPTPTNTPFPPSFVDEFGVPMVEVPEGKFQMGSEAEFDEEPVHDVFLRDYYMDQYEVTNEQYAACVDAGICTEANTADLRDPDFAQHPIENVSWDDAQTFCEWRGGRLPTEAEWEKGARGGLEGAAYPWGDDAPVCEVGAVNGAQYDACGGETVPVGSFASNGYGLYDMAGNIWEWVADWYQEDYYSSFSVVVSNPTGPETGDFRVLRGGSWFVSVDDVRPAFRHGFLHHEGIDGGFRCARSIIPEVPMVLIPAGSFQMGSEVGDSDESPVHTVILAEFFIDQYEVTNELYASCVDAGSCAERNTPEYRDPKFARFPVRSVSWIDAQAFCEWRGARLPTEAEWEKAARGGLEGVSFPWGNASPTCVTGAVNGAQFRDCEGDTAPVGRFAPNGYELYDMAGNVWEWVADWYSSSYYSNWPDSVTNPIGPDSGALRVLRGGGWDDTEYHLRSAFRESRAQDYLGTGRGFRCALTP